MVLLLSGVTALVALPMRTWLEFMDEGAVRVLVQGLLLVMLVIQVFSMWEQRHLRALCDQLAEQMATATEQRARADQLYGLSILDPLTGLYNRRFGERRLDEEVARAARMGNPLLLVSLDFDRFKAINDQHGHAAGDRVLQEFSQRLRRAIRSSDVPIRVGGDEFLVILPECPTDQLHTVLSRLTAFDLKLEGGTVHVSYSQGVVRYQMGDTARAMIERADERLYAEKAKRSAPSGTNASTDSAPSTDPNANKSKPPVIQYF
jgi:diguanylate cyclase (GGDEF)-like protein